MCSKNVKLINRYDRIDIIRVSEQKKVAVVLFFYHFFDKEELKWLSTHSNS